MGSLIPIQRARQRVPMMDAGTLEGRTRPAPAATAPLGARLLRFGLKASPAGSTRLRDWRRSAAIRSARRAPSKGPLS